MLILLPSSPSVQTTQLGWVADYCLLCHDVTPCSVVQKTLPDPTHFVPLGSGMTLSASRTCSRCGTETGCNPQSYKTFLPKKPASTCSVDELLERTNPQQDAIRKQLALVPEDFHARPDEDDSRQRLAMLRLRDLGLQTVEVFRFQDGLLDWHRLAPENRRKLWRDINAYVDGVRESQRLELFLQNVCKRAPQGAGCLLAIVIGVPLAIFLAVLGTRINDGGVGLGLLAFWVVFMLTCLFGSAHWTYRRFYKSRVIKPADIAGFEPSLVLEKLEQIKQQKPRNPHVRSMVNRLGMLKRLYRQREVPVLSE
jgi:hypothetical protein